jgi:Pyruvate/2-oxoacid:ferredoxin oxidoreductase delta subunit
VLWVIGERGHILGLPSTRRAMVGSQPGVEPKGIDLTSIHGYVYGTFTYEYIGFCINWLMERMGPRLGQWWGDHYHGKVIPLELAEAIITLDHDIERCDLEQIIPYPSAREILLSGPPTVELFDCPCRAAREDPCLPMDVCMLVGGGGWASDHHPTRTRSITQEEALDVLRAEHERGHVHTAYFKDACDNKFYAICNCCSCCCGGLEAMIRYDVPMVTASGFVAQVDEDLCIGCETCEEMCPFEAVTVNGSGFAEVNFDKCMGCGVCEGHCTEEAMTLVLEPRKGIPLDVRQIGV